MTAKAPEQVIREYLVEHGGSVEVDVAALAGSWNLAELSEADRRRVTAALASAGVATDPPLDSLSTDDRVTVRLQSESREVARAEPASAAAPAEPTATSGGRFGRRRRQVQKLGAEVEQLRAELARERTRAEEAERHAEEARQLAEDERRRLDALAREIGGALEGFEAELGEAAAAREEAHRRESEARQRLRGMLDSLGGPPALEAPASDPAPAKGPPAALPAVPEAEPPDTASAEEWVPRGLLGRLRRS